jgi:hypothetical protein
MRAMHIEPTTPRRARALGARRAAITAASALACAGLAACGSSSSTTTSGGSVPPLNTTRVAKSIEESVLTQRKIHVTVVCPASVPQEKGKVFECIATSKSTKAPFGPVKTPFVVTIQTSKGYVTYVGK